MWFNLRYLPHTVHCDKVLFGPTEGVFEVNFYYFETSILRIIEKRPVSVDTICFMTGEPSNRVLMKLTRMKKWKQVEVVTTREVMFWGKPRSDIAKPCDKACKG